MVLEVEIERAEAIATAGQIGYKENMSESASGRFEVADSVIYQSVQDEIVLLNLESQQYFGLDSVGADVWRLLLQNGTVDGIVAGMKAVYNAEESVLRSDVGTLLADLTGAGLLREVAGTASAC